ncbi:hypothetical protein L495_0542 [Bordetella bronchiseptica CARE970018BB]|uniref:hypothetical protein n=1 Tax=Bordetella bronchiseptica TaxID=518 RepID=UPI000460E7F4|nr:hypothetical protein [Bordetella bronchiseptica]KDB83928.1 hypothetical protein L495_0542 [Bordetella bronchiseptica CARE970018BB]
MPDKNVGPTWDFTPAHEFLDPAEDVFSGSVNFRAALDVHGMYEKMRFVLRLSPRNHELVDSLTTGVHAAGDISGEALQAYSTYLHETVHWWQHVGSSSGLVYSLCYMAQSHSSMAQLRDVISTFGPKKSLKRWTDATLLREGASAQSRLASANIAVNNALDVEYYKIYAAKPNKAAPWLYKQQHFESIGHGYFIVYGQLLGMLSGTVDPNFQVIPDARQWDEKFKNLNEQRVTGYYWGSPMYVPEIGLHAIYEGQARFIQLQFLNATFDKAPTIQDWRSMGYLSGIYVEAFEHFLDVSKSEWPDNLDDPLVGLFLLICDIAINPTRGFPNNIEIYENFIDDVDVGVRFLRLSQAVERLPHLRSYIQKYSKTEYALASELLTEACGLDKPLAALGEIVSWIDKSEEIQALMSEYETFDYLPKNLTLRVFFSHFLAFCCDKLARPEFFCWLGVWMVGDCANEDTMPLWLRHLSLFSDRGDKPGIYPRSQPGRDPATVHRTFEQFYGGVVLYDLTRQWILTDGPFTCNFEWLTESDHSQADADAWASDIFKQVYGVGLNEFEIIS